MNSRAGADSLIGELTRRIEGMDVDERAELARLVSGELDRAWRPDPRNKPQVAAYYSLADIVLYGGAAGGGKTELILGVASVEQERSVIFRKQSVDLRGIEDRLVEINGSKGWNGQLHYLKRKGLSIELGHLGKPNDEKSWQGRPHDFIGFDEVTQIAEHKVRFVLGWLRSARKKDGTVIRRRVIMGTNPPIGGDGDWIIRWFAPWLDELFPNKAQPGEIRWRVMSHDGTMHWVDGPGMYQVGDQPPVEALSCTFIPAFLKDNPYLAGTGYEAQIDAMPEPMRTQLKTGSFTVGREDHAMQVIPGEWVDEAFKRYARGKPRGAAMNALGADVAQGGKDNTCLAPLWGGNFFEQIVKHPGTATPDGPTAAGVIIAARRGHAAIGIDMTGGWGISARDHLRKANIEAVAVVFSKGTKARSRDGKFGFKNLRAQLFWQLREGLDPNGGDEIALAPNATLKAQLTAHRWHLDGDKIVVESKDEVIERVGSSPDEADATVIAWHCRTFYAMQEAARKEQPKDRQGVADPLDDWGGES